jgi:hypothetical protein
MTATATRLTVENEAQGVAADTVREALSSLRRHTADLARCVADNQAMTAAGRSCSYTRLSTMAVNVDVANAELELSVRMARTTGLTSDQLAVLTTAEGWVRVMLPEEANAS